MTKTIAYIASSIDGFIAETNGSINFLTGDGSANGEFDIDSYNNFLEKIDTIIMGSSTYIQIVNELSVNDWPYKGIMTYVLTTKNYTDKEGITFLNTDVNELIEKLRTSNVKGVWLLGGASTINKALDKSNVDVFELSIIPTVLGSGIKLFEERNFETKYKFISSKVHDGIVNLIYEKR